MSSIHITLSFLFLFIFKFQELFAAPTRHLCRPEQRDALLEFKNELEIRNSLFDMCNINGSYVSPHPKTESWRNYSDCCYWDGIKCDANSGKVIELDLSCSCLHGSFVGEIPSSFGGLNQLTDLDIESNKLSGTLPPNFTSLSNLRYFFAKDNTFVGPFPSLTIIDLGDNNLNGTLEFENISSPSQLQDLSLENNNLRGPIPRSISKLVKLYYLDLSHWNTQGPVDFSIFSHLKSLQKLDLSHLNTTTTIDLNAILSYFKSLQILYLSGNHVLTRSKSSVSHPPSQWIDSLSLSGCGITEFPELLRTLEHLKRLDISNNKITGQVPRWLWTLPELSYVNLSNNTFISFERSTKHGLSSVLKYLFGSKNNFTGNIPSFICEFRSLSILDLSNNNFSGSIPLCMGNLKSDLSVLNLCQNHLSGDLPESVFENLRSLDVGHNQLAGKLPRSLIHFSNLEVLNVESNRINDTFPFWLSSLQKLQVLVLRSNAFHGPIRKPRSLRENHRHIP
ncbi:unnamed protein product [Microthlaspi erraticum]|uniref:Leucine-rich repeat-containing N-terminal plant-type domain-containing protein n=1 Tax=Microthlaspi erraticum TaxID=1685480 RepID=A0A6D2ITV1_9BRAS|nr:unnamed protein product [Microthlaspi erraticum]